jgi:hypothetical protein
LLSASAGESEQTSEEGNRDIDEPVMTRASGAWGLDLGNGHEHLFRRARQKRSGACVFHSSDWAISLH